MFHEMSAGMVECMRRLQSLDAEQRKQGVPTVDRLCAVSPETGRFLALLAATVPSGALLEIGTSGGYSTLWLALAARVRGQCVQSFERSAAKLSIARDTFARSDVTDIINVTEGDVRNFLPDCRAVAFCFIDHEKSQYIECYEMLMPNLVAGAIIAADNIHSHEEALAPFVDHVIADSRVDAVVIPIGKGVLLVRKI